MLQYVVRRLILTLPVLLGILLISFMLTHISGDPTDLILAPDTPDEARELFRQKHGLDQPVWVQFYQFCVHALQGDFGDSLRFNQPAVTLVLERLGATTELAATAMLLAILIGIPAGVVAAYRRNTPTDATVRAVTLMGQAVPSFYLGILTIIIFAVWLRWLPSGGRGTWAHLILPASTLALNLVALIARTTRSCMLDVLNQDYIRTARAKGLGENWIVWGHALRNAFIPVLTVIGLQVGLLMGGVVVTETVFSWPGVGRLAIQAIYARDYPVVQAVVLFFAVIFVGVNLIVDLLYAVLDPRIGYR
ncbi:MAG: ABC transporter permease [Nitratireductor sp.]|jgi:peptide/nickel transport system permease protein|uniref:ABC transporter permease n=1 Tax=Hyphomicrobiales TaxID=356 RepID=UPI000FDC3645|nr:ABC transporter permease [Nitratireductor alexandrii]